MIVQPDFLEHWKTELLITSLDDENAPLYLIRLWAHCQNRKTHEFPRVNKNLLKSICKATKHDAEVFEKALVESGFVRIEDNTIIAHDWDDVNASLIAAWDNGKKGGRPRKKNPRVTQTKPMGNPDETDREDREEKIDREDKESFERVWALYDKKTGKAQAWRYWLKLSKLDREAVHKKIPEYVAATPDKKYRKDFSGWINPANRLWENEIVGDVSKPQPQFI